MKMHRNQSTSVHFIVTGEEFLTTDWKVNKKSCLSFYIAGNTKQLLSCYLHKAHQHGGDFDSSRGFLWVKPVVTRTL